MARSILCAFAIANARHAPSLPGDRPRPPDQLLHSDKKSRNSLVWNAIEPLRPAIDARVFAFIAGREFSRADFPQTGTNETGVVPCSQFRHASAARSISRP
jgi:hypothetical protein